MTDQELVTSQSAFGMAPERKTSKHTRNNKINVPAILPTLYKFQHIATGKVRYKHRFAAGLLTSSKNNNHMRVAFALSEASSLQS